MAGVVTHLGGGKAAERGAHLQEPRLVRWLLIGGALAFVALFLILPLAVVFRTALREGLGVWFASLTDRYTLHAIDLTLTAALIAVPLNALFGLAAAWAVTRHDFPGKRLLVTLIDIPFAVSPVIAGMMFVLLFGANSALGPWLVENDLRVVFAVPGIVLATTFVTFPFVARELIPLMQAQGRDAELASVTLGASGWQTFWYVTLPRVRWALFYGTVLCTARALGEFGAVSVVSGHIRGHTNTVSLHVEVLYNEYHTAAAFSVATLLVLVAVLTLGAKSLVEWRMARTALRNNAGP